MLGLEFVDEFAEPVRRWLLLPSVPVGQAGLSAHRRPDALGAAVLVAGVERLRQFDLGHRAADGGLVAPRVQEVRASKPAVAPGHRYGVHRAGFLREHLVDLVVDRVALLVVSAVGPSVLHGAEAMAGRPQAPVKQGRFAPLQFWCSRRCFSVARLAGISLCGFAADEERDEDLADAVAFEVDGDGQPGPSLRSVVRR